MRRYGTPTIPPRCRSIEGASVMKTKTTRARGSAVNSSFLEATPLEWFDHHPRSTGNHWKQSSRCLPKLFKGVSLQKVPSLPLDRSTALWSAVRYPPITERGLSRHIGCACECDSFSWTNGTSSWCALSFWIRSCSPKWSERSLLREEAITRQGAELRYS